MRNNRSDRGKNTRSSERRESNSKRHRSNENRVNDRKRSAENLSKERMKNFKPRKPVAAKAKPQAKSDREGERLNKYIAHAGICSRRDADMHIQAGSVTVNGKVVSEMGYRVLPGDEVRFDGRLLNAEKKVYVLLNKPKNYITTTDDPQKRRTVLELLKGAGRERLYPVGRLDRNTTGVLLFTNDGEVARKLTHPTSNVRKIYHVTLDKSLSVGDFHKIREGLELEDGFIQPDTLSYIEGSPKKELGIEIHSGRNRIVRRIFEHLGYTVTKLDRVQMGFMTKKNLTRGTWRFLDESEINMLKMM